MRRKDEGVVIVMKLVSFLVTSAVLVVVVSAFAAPVFADDDGILSKGEVGR
jgi:hypothetical protein